jgi:amino acid transporter
MVAVSFGSYASSLFTGSNAGWANAFAVVVVIAMTVVNIAGSAWVAKLQSMVVFVVVGILCVFAIVTIANMHPSLLAPSKYPSFSDIVSAVALTFFAYLGFGVITFTAKDLAKPSKQLPRAMYLALGIATVIYVAVSIGVFGTLTVAEVIAAGPTAIAEAARPVLGEFGFVLMGVTALFATAGATNAGMYPAAGLCDELASTGQFPPVMGARLGGRASVGLLIQAAAILVLVLGFDLSAIASIGSAVALMIFTLVTLAHFPVRSETGASTVMLVLAVATAAVTLLTFVFTELIHEPASMITLAVIIGVSVLVDAVWTRRRDRRAPPAPAGQVSTS